MFQDTVKTPKLGFQRIPDGTGNQNKRRCLGRWKKNNWESSINTANIRACSQSVQAAGIVCHGIIPTSLSAPALYNTPGISICIIFVLFNFLLTAAAGLTLPVLSRADNSNLDWALLLRPCLLTPESNPNGTGSPLLNHLPSPNPLLSLPNQAGNRTNRQPY